MVSGRLEHGGDGCLFMRRERVVKAEEALSILVLFCSSPLAATDFAIVVPWGSVHLLLVICLLANARHFFCFALGAYRRLVTARC